MKILRVQMQPLISEAIQWESNEPEIREFVEDPNNVRFKDRGLEVWNSDTQTWQNCPMFSYIIRGQKGEFSVLSPELFEKYYSVLSE